MNITEIAEAPFAIQLHLGAALLSLALTPPMILMRKGTARHKAMGRVWVAAMAVTALSSFWISTIRLIGPFSPIHILSIITLVSLVRAVVAVRRGDIAGHKSGLLGAAGGLVGAGLFTLLPGRMLSKTLFEGVEIWGFVSVMLLGGAAAIWLMRRGWQS